MNPPPGPPAPLDDVNLPRLGRYQARRLLGSGGSGTVYAAVDLVSGSKVALKVLSHGDHLHTEARERFLREAQLAAAVKCPHVVEYLDVGNQGDVLYLATELLGGGDAHQLSLRYSTGLPVIMAAAIGRDCARGLAAIHAAGLIHRDVKPSNIFLGTTGIAKLGDLGLARSLATPSSLTAHGNLVGTPDFMAPEQAMASEHVDHRADLYALAASIFFLVAGRPPHIGHSAWGVLAQLINEPFPDPRQLRPDLSPTFAHVMLKAGAKDPAKRYQDALHLAEDLDAVITGREPSVTSTPHRITVRMDKPAATRPHQVLLVDDDPLIRRLYRVRFERDGFAVATAADGTEALALAAQARPDVVLLDCMLPGDDGVTVLRKLRAMPGLERLPALVFSGTLSDEHQEAARQLGVARVLSKAQCTPRQVSDQLRQALVRNGKTLPPRTPTDRTAKDEQPPTGLFQLAETTLLRLQVLLGRLGRDAGIAADRSVLAELVATAHGLAAAAGTVQSRRTALLAEATEYLARQLLGQPERISPSCLHTIAQAVSGLHRSLPRLMAREPLPTLHAVAVDDEPIALKLACRALGKVSITSARFHDPHAALTHLASSPADLVISDVMMAGLNGVQFASRIRAMPEHRTTPIIFVTGVADFANRLASVHDPHLDVITKPILLGELMVKALSLVLAR